MARRHRYHFTRPEAYARSLLSARLFFHAAEIGLATEIRGEREQWAAREYLHVEPVVVKGAGHANIIFLYANDVVDAATKGL